MDNTQDGWKQRLGLIESDGVHKIELAIFNSGTFKVLISQSGNEPYGCAREVLS